MKNVLLLLLLAVTLYSCEKDENGNLYDSGLIKSIEFKTISNQPNKKITIKYDDLDRVYSINDTVFYYGANGKVAYSRYAENIDKDGYKIEKIIKKSFNWDGQNRLLEIHVDSMYQKNIDPTGIVVVTHKNPFTEALFYYTGNQTLPDSIAYSDGLSSTYLTYKRFYHSNGNINKIEETENVGPFDPNNGSSAILKSTFLDYNDQDNYLFPLYQKLGFLPKDLGYVTSRKLLSTSEIVETIVVEDLAVSLANKKTTVKNTYLSNRGPNGYPTLINITSMIDFDNGQGYSSVGNSEMYIHY